MNPLTIEPTKTTPEVRFHAEENRLVISGQSYPENSFEFYWPIKKWIEDHLARDPEQFVLEFRMDYFNTSSSKCLLDLLEILESYHAVNPVVKVLWHFDEDDEDMEDSGHDFGEDLNLPFELVPYSIS